MLVGFALLPSADARPLESAVERFMAMAETKVWTLEELHSLPEDGNKYELLHGELFVTPPPTFVCLTTGLSMGTRGPLPS